MKIQIQRRIDGRHRGPKVEDYYTRRRRLTVDAPFTPSLVSWNLLDSNSSSGHEELTRFLLESFNPCQTLSIIKKKNTREAINLNLHFFGPNFERSFYK